MFSFSGTIDNNNTIFWDNVISSVNELNFQGCAETHNAAPFKTSEELPGKYL